MSSEDDDRPFTWREWLLTVILVGLIIYWIAK